MGRFAVRGLLSRKLRTALTAVAIVLGVAMISGTYVLTDSIDQAFDRIFTDIRAGVERRHHRQVGLRPERGQRRHRADLRRVVAPGGAGAPRGGGGRGQRRLRRDAAHRRRRQGGRLRRRAEPRLLDREPELAVQPAHADRRRLAGAERGRRRQGDRREGGLRGRRDRSACRSRGRCRSSPLAGIIQFSSGLTIGGATLAGFDLADRPAADGEGRLARRDRGRGEAGRDRAGARLADRGDPPGRDAGQDGQRAGAGRRGGDERVHHVPAGLPARVRRDRALRRLVRHRQLAVDHDRPANARARHAADARRVAATGARLDHRRVAHRGRRRLGDRALSRAAPREGALLALRRGRLHAAEHGARVRDRARSSSRSPPESSSRCSRACGRRRARHACRRSRPSARARRCRPAASRATAGSARCS